MPSSNVTSLLQTPKGSAMSTGKPPFDAQPVEPSVGERLDSWKEIATYLKRDESTMSGDGKRRSASASPHAQEESCGLRLQA